jgi:hypothetical protein
MAEGARSLGLLLVAGLFLGAAPGVSSGQSGTISFCVADKAMSSTYYLTDLTAPIPGQSVAEDQFTQGRLVLGGGFIPDPAVEIVAADQTVVANGTVDWVHSAHRRAAEYNDALAKLCARADLTSSRLFSVVPIGLAGSPSDTMKGTHQILPSSTISSTPSAAPPGAHQSQKRSGDPGGPLSMMFWRAPAVPRLWPMLRKAVRGADQGHGGFTAGRGRAGAQAGTPSSEEQARDTGAVVTSIVRFVVSLQRYKVRVVDEESLFVQSLAVQKTRKSAPGGDPHPDLREGILKSDLPKAYVAEVGYGHRLLLSVNISVPVSRQRPPANLESVGQLLMRVVARDLGAPDFDQMFPGVSLYARFRWDPDLAPPLDAIKYMQEMRDLFYGEPLGALYNHTRDRCLKGSFRRSRHQPARRLKPPTCPADEWPSQRIPEASWVMHAGGAQLLQERIEAWRTAMTFTKSTALQAVPLSLQVRREVTAGDATWAMTQLEAFNLTTLNAPRDSTTSQQKAAIAAIRQRLRDRAIVEYSTTTCMQSSVVPLPLMLALGDLLVFLSLSILVMFCAWWVLSSKCVIRAACCVDVCPYSCSCSMCAGRLP